MKTEFTDKKTQYSPDDIEDICDADRRTIDVTRIEIGDNLASVLVVIAICITIVMLD